MPNFVQTVKLNKLPVLGLVPESSIVGAPPSAPGVGQLWVDTTNAVVKFWNGTAWIPWLAIGTGAGQAADGSLVLTKANNLSDVAVAATARTNLGLLTGAVNNKVAAGAAGVLDATDASTTNQRVPTDASVTGGTAGAGVKLAALTITAANIANAAITDVQVAAANKDGAVGTASMRTLGFGATQALSGTTVLTQIAAPTGPLNMNGQKIINLAAPTAASDAARLVDVQGAAAGIDAQPSVRITSTANVVIATNGLTAIDGVTPAAGDRVLLKNQTAPAENGVYIAAVGAWARATDSITANTFWFTEEGTANSDSQWMVTTNNPITLGTTGLVISQFGAATAYTGTVNRITVAGSVLDISTNYVGQASIVTVGVIATGTWQATPVGLLYGGTGATTAAGARTAIGASAAGYAALLAALVAGTPLIVTHNLGTQDVIVQVRDATTNEILYLDIINSSTTTVSVTSGVAYSANATRIVVLSV